MNKPILLASLILSLSLSAVAEEYTHLWWAHGYRGASPEGRRMMHAQTSHFGAAFDVESANITRLGLIDDPASYAESTAQPNSVIDALASASLEIAVTAQGQVFRCVRAAQLKSDEANYPVRLIAGGRWLHRFDVLGLEFEDATGHRLSASGRLEVSVWPERLHLALSLTPEHDLLDAEASMTLAAGETREEEKLAQSFLASAGEQASVQLAWPPLAEACDAARLSVRDGVEGDALPVAVDAARGGYWVSLPARQWEMASNLDQLDRYPVRIENPGAASERYPIVFAMEGGFQGVTGVSATLADAAGRPTGIPVQVSKNWHRRPERRLLYEGAWLHAVTEVEVPAGGTWEGELRLSYARWGGVPAASHAQLSLIGWGGNQRWDQAAIGSFGESICYDPDVGLNRSIIDDVRPLMVRGMNDGQWEWTHNVGGGDVALYVDASGARQYLSRMRTAYLSQGPNLTHVVYGGQTPDGKMEVRFEAMTPRGDDVNRAYHRLRFHVRETMPFQRLAFYQLGADGYNDHQFTTIARGNREGLTEEWQTERGGKRYLREAMGCEGAAPWFALLGGLRAANVEKGAWADRAMVIRHWRARLGGLEVPLPQVSVYGTENGIPSANVEVSPPAGLKQLEAGDFLEVDVELLVLPQSAADYYGPNASFRELLSQHAGTWKLPHALARDNDIAVTAAVGTLVHRLPVCVQVNESQEAVVNVRGGRGYLPVTFTGVTAGGVPRLEVDGALLDQKVHGNDYWQVVPDGTGEQAVTFNVPCDGSDVERVLRFYKAEE